jgi:hypothetical protein
MLHVRDMIEAYLRVAQRLDEPMCAARLLISAAGTPLELQFVVSEAARAGIRRRVKPFQKSPQITGPKVGIQSNISIFPKRGMCWDGRHKLRWLTG